MRREIGVDLVVQIVVDTLIGLFYSGIELPVQYIYMFAKHLDFIKSLRNGAFGSGKVLCNRVEEGHTIPIWEKGNRLVK